jgi:hypothetical protein
MSSSGLARGPSAQRAPPAGSRALPASQERCPSGADRLSATSTYVGPWVLGTSPRMTQVGADERNESAHLIFKQHRCGPSIAALQDSVAHRPSLAPTAHSNGGKDMHSPKTHVFVFSPDDLIAAMTTESCRKPFCDVLHQVWRRPVYTVDRERKVQRLLNLPEGLMPIG